MTRREMLTGITHRRCWKCDTEKPIVMFQWRQERDGNYFRTTCIPCESARKIRQKNLDRPASLAYMRNYSKRLLWSLKLKVIEHYGGVCACCPEHDPHFLELDHINGGGRTHRKMQRGGDRLYKWLIERNFASDIAFQLLCTNCNTSRGSFGFCPHQGADPRLLTIKTRYVWKLRCETINHYGGRCACCAEDSMYFLQVDHTKQNGAVDRRQAAMIRPAYGRGGMAFYAYLRQQGFPRGYRVLCASCNAAMWRYKGCPHQGRREQWVLF